MSPLPAPEPLPASSGAPTSTVTFLVHSGLPEIKAFADSKGWTEQGFTQLSIVWQEMVFTTDHWQTTHTLRSTGVPSDGRFMMPVPEGTEVQFAMHVGVACRAPEDLAGGGEHSDLWLNNDGQNYRQVTSSSVGLPGVDQLESAAGEIVGVARRQPGAVNPSDGGNLGVSATDGPARSASGGVELGADVGGG